tara:strand:- start:12835 stop:13605 length:771 start_codon:yes stop_codon:yes gene_type:complete
VFSLQDGHFLDILNLVFTKITSMDIIYSRKVNTNELPNGAIAEVNLFCIEVKNVNEYAMHLTNKISDTSWISSLDYISQDAYNICAEKTINKLVELFNLPENKVTSDFGEYLVSLSSGECLESKHSHTCLPISEIWKESKEGNPGFDFHTLSTSNKINFGEAKYQSNGNAYTSAAAQTHRFSREKKDRGDSVHLKNMVSKVAIDNLVLHNKKGYVVSFSINSQDHSEILNNSLNNNDIKELTKLCDELYIIGVKVK